ncbi:MAG: hypothetical protein JW765_06500 [Deltaproteobacteria bacterium]|nr:hypothetical protein [Candidatus Zymogenaceae bacterium]
MTDNRRKTVDEVLLDYLREEEAVSGREPTECLIPSIARARRARFATGGRLVFADDRDAAADQLTALNASAWVMVSEVEGFEGFSHLIKTHDDLWLVEIEWGKEEAGSSKSL